MQFCVQFPISFSGVIAMFASLLILLAMPLLDTSRVRGAQFRPLMRWAFWLFVADFALLMQIGAEHVENPWILVGQIATVMYFAFFFVIVPVIGVIENTLIDVASEAETSEETVTQPAIA